MSEKKSIVAVHCIPLPTEDSTVASAEEYVQVLHETSNKLGLPTFMEVPLVVNGVNASVTVLSHPGSDLSELIHAVARAKATVYEQAFGEQEPENGKPRD